MKIKSPAFVPPHFAKLMSQTDREAVGIITPQEAKAHADTRLEKELQRDINCLLDQRGIFYSRARMDKRTTVRVGMFDYTIYLPTGKFLAVEVKVKNGKLSIFQNKLFEEFWDKTGQVVHIVTSLDQMQKLINEHMPA